jgi:Protein of unknown function (DUF667)
MSQILNRTRALFSSNILGNNELKERADVPRIMFENDYQGGSSFEILSGNTKALEKNWKLSRSVMRSFSSDIKGYAYLVDNGKLLLPKDGKSVVLYQPFVLFQANIASGACLSIEFTIQDLSNRTKRFFLSTSIKQIKTTPLHVSMPLNLPKSSGWTNICVDLQSLITKFYSGASYKSLSGITLHGSLGLSKIITLKTRPADPDSIPKILELPAHIPIITLIIDSECLSDTKHKSEPALVKPSSPVSTAFGRSLPKVYRVWVLIF